MQLIKEIRDEVVSEDVSLASVLRKAKIAAVSLQHEEFQEWIDAELNGYTDPSKIPPYRKLHSPILGNYRGPMNSSMKGQQLPVSLLPDSVGDNPTEISYGHPIKEIETLAEKEQEGLRHPWPTEAVLLLRDCNEIQMTGGMVLSEVYQPLNKSQLVGILDVVRNRLLEFLLRLQEINPEILESEDALETIPTETVEHAFNVTIRGDHNVVASGEQIQQNVSQDVQTGDISSLMDHLRDIGLEEDDLNQLRNAIETDGQIEDNELGTRVKTWLGEITGKISTGALTGVSTQLVTKALFSYYGIT